MDKIPVDSHQPRAARKMGLGAKALFSAISGAFLFAGTMAIVLQTRTAYSRFEGQRTVNGAEAVWAGQTLILVGLLPLVVWLPTRWVGAACTVWWLALMAWLFAPLFLG